VGGLVASTRKISVDDFMANRYRFTGDSDARILNQGSINADGGYVALLGANVSNEGTIAARLGTVTLASGNAFTLDLAGDGLLNVSVDAGAIGALAQNGGLIEADGGQVLLTAQSAGSLLPAAVNNTGLIQAQSISNHNGTIKLLGDMQSGTTNVAGTLDASAPNGGNGGFIETSAAHVKVAPDVTISTAAPAGAAGEWLIDPVDFTVAASGGDMTGTALSAALSGSNVTIQSTAGASGTAGDVNVNDDVSWSANKLTLNAQGNISINAGMNGSGSASVAFVYGQGAVAAGNTGRLNVRVPVNLPAGANLSTLVGSDGSVVSYSVISTMAGLQAINAGLTGNYALGSDLNASGFSGYVPLGDSTTPFSGIFNGLAHTISNLNVSRNVDNGGLFGYTDTAALITSLRMSNTVVSTGSRFNAGSLVGFNNGTVRDVYSTGVTISAPRQAGGLVGWNRGLIETSATGTGTTAATFYSGGLVAMNDSTGTIRNSYSGVNSRNYLEVGGLVGGMDAGTIENSYAMGTPSGGTSTFGTGGFVGYVGGGTVSNSFWNSQTYSVGVRTGSSTGMTGLTTAGMKTQSNFASAGWDFNNIWYMYPGSTTPLLRAFMTPLTVTANNVSATYSGLAYAGTAGVQYSVTPDMSKISGTPAYASSGVDVGGYSLTPSGIYSSQLGYMITFAPGTLTIDPYAVSLTGTRAYNGSTAISSSALTMGTLAHGETLALTGTGSVVSKDAGSGKTLTLGTLALTGGTGLASNYTFTGGTQTVDISKAVLTAGAVAAADKAYDGDTSASVTLAGLAGFAGSETVGVTGTGTFNSKNVTGANLVTVNSVVLADGSNGGLALNYSLAGGQTAVAHITPRVLTALASSIDKVYDGNASATVTLAGLTNLAGSETLGVSGTGTFNSKDVATANLVTVGAVMLADGSNGGLASNYSLASGQTAVAHISPQSLTASAAASDKIYDGGTLATVTLSGLTGLVGTETLGANGTGTFNSKDVADANVVTVNSVSLTDGTNGGLASNYTLGSGQTAAAQITRKALTVLGQVAANKQYDGNTNATLSGGTLSGVISGESVQLSEAGAFVSADVGSNVAVTAYDGIAGAAAVNYSLTQPMGLTANIAAVPVAPPVAPPVVPPVSPPVTPPVTPPVAPPAPVDLASTVAYQSAVGAVTVNAAAMLVPSIASPAAGPMAMGAPAPVSPGEPTSTASMASTSSSASPTSGQGAAGNGTPSGARYEVAELNLTIVTADMEDDNLSKPKQTAR
ncbi:MAG: YDG domain-containing protein, partial [Gammaproteobacteria bacterium]